MANPNPRTDQLPKQQPRWRHLPTRAIRVPEILLGDIERYARSLDNGEKTEKAQTIQEFLETASIEELLSLKQNLEKAIERAKARSKDNRLESAILYLSDQCDGTRKEDGRGFNKVDTEFGHWLARRIASGSLLKHQAKAGLKMIQKYQTQLEPAGYTLPDWKAIELQYPDKFESKEEESPYRIEILENKIAVYAPYDATGRFQKKAKAIEGYRFDSSDKSWRYPLAKVIEVIEAFPSPEYSIDPEIEGIRLMIEGERAAELAEREKEAETAANDILNLVAAAELDRPLAGIGHLFSHQKEAVKWLLAHRTGGIYRGGILADDMGLGKTLSALVAARAMAKIHGCPIFVICPASLKDNWLREAAKVGVAIEVFSWGKIPPPLESQNYLAIADEAHWSQNKNTARTKKLLELAHHENCLGSWLLSVAGETPVVIKDNDRTQARIQVMTIAKAAESMGLEGEGTKILQHHERFFVRSFNQDKKCMEWARIYGVQAHYSPEPLITIKAQGKTSIRITKGHSLYVFREGKIIQPQAENIKPGDYLIKDANISIDCEISEIDLVEYISLYDSAFQGYVIYGDFDSAILMQKSLGNINSDTSYNWLNNGKHGCYMTYQKWNEAGQPGNYCWIAGRNGSKGRGAIPIVPVQALAWLVGYTSGDGWATKNRLYLAIANSDLETIVARLHKDLDQYFDWTYDIRQYKGCVNLRINCKPLTDIFFHWFGGQKAFSKRIPSECFHWLSEARKLIVEGLIDSDGYNKTVKSLNDSNLETTTIFYTSISQMLLEDIKVLLLTLNIESVIHTRKMVQDARPEFSNCRQGYVLRFCLSRIEPSFAERQTHKLGLNVQNAQLLKVLQVITEKPTKELVYDFAVEGTENFVASGVVCHNTGTPIKNGRPINLFPLLQITQHPLAADSWEFQKYYCNAHHKSIGTKSIWDNTGAAHLDELSKKTEDVILRRKKAECLDLPPKLRSLIPILLEGEASKNYRQEIDRHISEYRERENRGEVKEGAEALVTINALRKVGSLYKVPAAIEYTAELLEQGQAVVIFTEYLESAKALYTALSQIATCELLTGETKQEERQAIVDRFQSGTSKIFIGTIKAGGVGLTLTAANQVILVDRPWTPGDADQAEDRCYRIGQNNTVNAYWIQLGAIDEAIDTLLAEKRDRIELVLKGKRKTLRGLSKPSELAKELLEIL